MIAEADATAARAVSVGINRANAISVCERLGHAAGDRVRPCVPYIRAFSLERAIPCRHQARLGPRNLFHDHSYRGLPSMPLRALLMLNIDAKTSIQHWCRLDAQARRSATARSRSRFAPAILRSHCRAHGHVMAIGDIVEPVEEWRTYKFEQTQRKWDYVFRILYYTWTPDIAQRPFAEPIEIANVDKTGRSRLESGPLDRANGDANVL